MANNLIKQKMAGKQDSSLKNKRITEKKVTDFGRKSNKKKRNTAILLPISFSPLLLPVLCYFFCAPNLKLPLRLNSKWLYNSYGLKDQSAATLDSDSYRNTEL